MILKDVLNNLPNTEKNVCLSYSGGLDSTILLHLLVLKYGKDKVKTISFHYGQRHNIELEMAYKNIENLNVYNKLIDISFLGNITKNTCSLIKDSKNKPKTYEENAGDPQVDTYVPYRNLIFSSIVASFAESENCEYVFLATNATDLYGYWDTSEEFTNRLNNISSLNRANKVIFVSPFTSFYKADEIQLASELTKEFNFDVVKYHWSCYNGETKECGVCNTCREKLIGFLQNNDFYNDKYILDRFNISSKTLEEIKECL